MFMLRMGIVILAEPPAGNLLYLMVGFVVGFKLRKPVV